MKKLRQFDALVIEELTKQQFHQPAHGQTYYEIIYILKGSGIHHVNNSQLKYQARDLFLISPNDTHYLEIKSLTQFGVIKFTDSYFAGRQTGLPDALWKVQPREMMLNKAMKEQRLVMDKPAQQQAHRIVLNLLSYKDREDKSSAPFIFYQVLALLSLVEEQWEIRYSASPSQQHTQTLLSFIHQHIYDPEKIQIRYLADTFHISPGYFSVYFKEKFGIGFRQYVDNYRIKLIEYRILAGFTVRQIAEEFDFNDESHLSHFFKRKHGITISQFRQKNQTGNSL